MGARVQARVRETPEDPTLRVAGDVQAGVREHAGMRRIRLRVRELTRFRPCESFIPLARDLNMPTLKHFTTTF